MNTGIFYLENNKLRFNTHKITIRHYSLKDGDADKSVFKDEEQYVNSEGLHELEVNYVPKHKLLEIVLKERIDTSEYEWMEGIELRSNNPAKEIAEIASYGSIEAYESSLPESTDEFKIDTDYRLSKLELGL